MIFAQAADWSGFASVISAAVQVGFSVVVAWYLMARGIPAMQAQFSADLKSQREDFQKFQDRDRDVLKNIGEFMAKVDSEKLQRVLEMLTKGIERQIEMYDDLRLVRDWAEEQQKKKSK